jgi:hypothetical protein
MAGDEGGASVGLNEDRRYSVGTWDTDRNAYTPQRGLSVPCLNITIHQLRTALKQIRQCGYSAHRFRDEDGSHEDNDWAVLVERTDGKPWREILRNWRRAIWVIEHRIFRPKIYPKPH